MEHQLRRVQLKIIAAAAKSLLPEMADSDIFFIIIIYSFVIYRGKDPNLPKSTYPDTRLQTMQANYYIGTEDASQAPGTTTTIMPRPTRG